MKTLEEQDHYDVLEVKWGAKAAEIDHAYRVAQSAYAPDSLALYSVFEPGDATQIRERIELAYRVLSDEESRTEYDARLVSSGGRAESSGPVASAIDLHALEEAPREVDYALEAEPDDAGPWSGIRLRRERMRRGVELEEISRTTKINDKHLGAIEEDRYADLPAAVYVRGFVIAYARAIGLDAEECARSYLAEMERSRPARARRLLGR